MPSSAGASVMFTQKRPLLLFLKLSCRPPMIITVLLSDKGKCQAVPLKLCSNMPTSQSRAVESTNTKSPPEKENVEKFTWHTSSRC